MDRSLTDKQERLRQKIEYQKQQFYVDRNSEHFSQINDLEKQASRMAALRQQAMQQKVRSDAEADFAERLQRRMHERDEVQIPFEVKIKAPEVDRTTLPIYSPKDVDSLISMLTLWVEDRKVIQNMEEMYKHWKATQKI